MKRMSRTKILLRQDANKDHGPWTKQLAVTVKLMQGNNNFVEYRL